MIALSVIIPTRNRAAYARDAVRSALEQTLDPASYEVIVVDNGSRDTTRGELDELNRACGGRIRYLCDERPGLHVGRNLGAREARSGLLVYTDDDVLADRGWLRAILDAFADPSVALVGGKVLPRWEGPVPAWIEQFRGRVGHGSCLGYLSLIDLGDQMIEVAPEYVFGCNFSIRRSVLDECGGFHPDAMPQELIRYRGDGESAVSAAIRQRGMKAVYAPGALVCHRIPPQRLTVRYFCRRAFNQGVSDSFTEIRRLGGLPPSEPCPPARRARRALSAVRLALARVAAPNSPRTIGRQVARALEIGSSYHRRQVARDPDLLRYVLQKDYLGDSP